MAKTHRLEPAQGEETKELLVPLEAVESPRLYRQIADQLRHLIEGGEFPVGSRLPSERELAEKLGVSRPSVREALIALEVEGRVRIRMGSGVYVVDPPLQAIARLWAGSQPEGPFEVLKARELIESAICAEVVAHVEPADIAALDMILEQMESSDAGGEEILALDRSFHTTVAGILRNAVLVRCVGDLFDQRISPYFRQLARHFETAESWRSAAAEHRAIRDALARGDAPGAQTAMHRHLQKSQERFSQSFGDAGICNGPAAPQAGPIKKKGRLMGTRNKQGDIR